jgi:hypothetical protein
MQVAIPAGCGLVVADAATRVQTLGPLRGQLEPALTLALVATLRVETAAVAAEAGPLLALVHVLTVVLQPHLGQGAGSLESFSTI